MYPFFPSYLRFSTIFFLFTTTKLCFFIQQFTLDEAFSVLDGHIAWDDLRENPYIHINPYIFFEYIGNGSEIQHGGVQRLCITVHCSGTVILYMGACK